jgi:hypothetical protein
MESRSLIYLVLAACLVTALVSGIYAFKNRLSLIGLRVNEAYDYLLEKGKKLGRQTGFIEPPRGRIDMLGTIAKHEHNTVTQEEDYFLYQIDANKLNRSSFNPQFQNSFQPPSQAPVQSPVQAPVQSPVQSPVQAPVQSQESHTQIKKEPKKIKKKEPKPEPPKQEPSKQEPPKQEPPKQEPPKQEPPKQEPPKQEPPKQEPPKQEPPKQEPPKIQQSPFHQRNTGFDITQRSGSSFFW